MNQAEKYGDRFKRENARAQVVPSKISGVATVVYDQTTEQIPFLVWDVSPTGIGLLASEQIPVGREVTLTIGQPYLLVLKTRVIWCLEQGKERFRCGLQVREDSAKLKALYQEYCKLKT